MAREPRCDAALALGRLRRAEAFLEAGDLVSGLVHGDRAEETELAAALVTLWVHAGIAAADVICCARLGRHHAGTDHHGALQMLRKADGDRVAALRRLLDLKAPAAYGHRLVGRDDRLRAERAARSLVQRASEVIG